jgi:regulator of cell morphogenesis and NO signaling
MQIGAESPIGGIAVEYPNTIPYFEERGIDYCCGGNRTLAQGCATAGVAVEDALRELDRTLSGREGTSQDGRWKGLSPLIDHLLEVHHTFTRSQLELLRSLSAKVLKVHGERHPELKEIALILQVLDEELQHHLLKEEKVAFPYLLQLERAARGERLEGMPFPFYAFANGPQQVLMGDHESAGEQLRQLRRLTGDHIPPPGACVSFQAFYRGLADLEKDLHLHIHLENNVLFPMAQELAAGSRKTG